MPIMRGLETRTEKIKRWSGEQEQKTNWERDM
jgi:hypothetical protein